MLGRAVVSPARCANVDSLRRRTRPSRCFGEPIGGGNLPQVSVQPLLAFLQLLFKKWDKDLIKHSASRS